MKENPAMHKIIENMKPGVLSLHGFLGNDRRGLEQIIDHDAAQIEELDTSCEELADGLERIRDRAMEGLGDFISLGEGYTARADSIRGKLPCPFEHKGLYRKTVVIINIPGSDKKLQYTDLGIHLVREHGFFQGKGSPFRLEPAELVDIFGKI